MTPPPPPPRSKEEEIEGEEEDAKNEAFALALIDQSFKKVDELSTKVKVMKSKTSSDSERLKVLQNFIDAVQTTQAMGHGEEIGVYAVSNDNGVTFRILCSTLPEAETHLEKFLLGNPRSMTTNLLPVYVPPLMKQDPVTGKIVPKTPEDK